MRVLEFSVMGQQIEKRGDFSGLVAGSEQYMTAKFYFDREWAGKVKVAEFLRIDSKIAECFSEKIAGNCCIVRTEVLHGKKWYVNVVGLGKDGMKLSTNRVEVKQEE